MPKRRRFRPNWNVILIAAFAVAMGYLEAAAVVYIREIFEIGPHPVIPEMGREDIAFSLGFVWFLRSTAALKIFAAGKFLLLEQLREAATIGMLITFAYLVGKNSLEKLGAFLLTFGIWDVFYYVFLYILLRWPPSLGALDVVFLIPSPWVAPVYVPLLGSIAMILAGGAIFGRESRSPLRVARV